jgi:hypothetical protein
LPAMQTPRCSRYTEVMLSQASQLLQLIAHSLGAISRHIGRDRTLAAVAPLRARDQTGLIGANPALS